MGTPGAFITATFLIYISLTSVNVLATGEAQSFLQKCKQTDFGKTIISTLELKLETNAPADYLMKMLGNMRNMVYADLEKANSLHTDFQAKCKSTLHELAEDIREHARKVKESQDIIKGATAKLAWNKVQKENQERQVKELQGNLEKIRRQRGEEAEDYEKKVQEINEALLVLQQGRAAIEKGLTKGASAAPSFVETKSTFESYVDRMSEKVESGGKYMGRGYVSLLELVAEALDGPQSPHGAAAQQVIGMIQGIIDQLERTKNIEYQAEQERIANFKKIEDEYLNSIDELNHSIQKLENQISLLTQRIDYNSARQSENTRAISNKKREQLKERKSCKDEDAQFQKEDKKRRTDLELLDEAIKVMQEHMDEFKAIVLQAAKANLG
eukprot:TRINITY_DN1598_c0_g1_i1.p1 TRINITY_DN1598_c0_g1~~TRINITY_DN1598_c0_g1_i1.p1  ORF type:complete len:385 (-),score=156.01 TRINITY_DN1598_c0_g1_i1:106-1260(-)